MPTLWSAIYSSEVDILLCLRSSLGSPFLLGGGEAPMTRLHKIYVSAEESSGDIVSVDPNFSRTSEKSTFSLTIPGSLAGSWFDRKQRFSLGFAPSSEQRPVHALARIYILTKPFRVGYLPNLVVEVLIFLRRNITNQIPIAT